MTDNGQRPLFAMPVTPVHDPYRLVHHPPPCDDYPVGHPCYPKPLHTHTTQSATNRLSYDFHRRHIQMPHRHAQNRAGAIPQRNMPMTAVPDDYRAVRIPARRCRMGINVPLEPPAGSVAPAPR